MDDLVQRLRDFYPHPHELEVVDEAADRIEALTAENKRLGQQCEGLMQAGMNNGQALILAEAKLAKASETLRLALKYNTAMHRGASEFNKRILATLAEIKG